MRAASRVRVVPPAEWSEGDLIAAARTMSMPGRPVRPGDAVGELIVVAVEPAPGAALVRETEVEIIPAPRGSASRVVDIALVIDVSESMGTPWDAKYTRLEAAVVAVTSFLQTRGSAVASVSIYHYAKNASLVAGPVGPGALAVVPAAAPRGSSETGSALNTVLADLAALPDGGHAQVILMFTDGLGDIAELRAAAERARRLGVPIHSLVFAPEIDPLFQELADASGGSVQQAAYPLTIEFVHEPGGSP